MKKKVIIVGSGGLGREVYSWLTHEDSAYEPIGFISDDFSSLDKYDYPVKVIDSIANFKPIDNVSLIMAIMDPIGKKYVYDLLLSKGMVFDTFIHPTVVLGRNIIIGNGSVICPNCILTCDIQLGDGVFLNTATTLGHDVSIGDFSSLNGKVEVSGWVKISSVVTIGSRALILPKKKIGEGSTIGAGSVVVGNVKQNITVFGNPAKRI
ncbi:NeuD/PglB/VioB family sugar acetyltransferase [Vibrio lentus]|uniref:PglD N-terminal domain-containing protein n=1 Tax=Vibrio lentus TaxID=136468 RepID=A0A2N7IA47_9VIBR|nr:NeuD/PglB/VioB family sugar acetyltransferase [Vibrio lentus]PML53289.1 hypothetical protein BCT74_12285 [Vibrio lentus]PMM38487.1 hypothetical protein BCT58_24115 [Vibrio lentus]